MGTGGHNLREALGAVTVHVRQPLRHLVVGQSEDRWILRRTLGYGCIANGCIRDGRRCRLRDDGFGRRHRNRALEIRKALVVVRTRFVSVACREFRAFFIQVVEISSAVGLSYRCCRRRCLSFVLLRYFGSRRFQGRTLRTGHRPPRRFPRWSPRRFPRGPPRGPPRRIPRRIPRRPRARPHARLRRRHPIPGIARAHAHPAVVRRILAPRGGAVRAECLLRASVAGVVPRRSAEDVILGAVSIGIVFGGRLGGVGCRGRSGRRRSVLGRGVG
mmetsp:Transcript_42670/g.89516  ORF Transcript_42670/g.89516 Transcript_42670/m.89516 type:complete len:273 (-) Transcript_42670:106-924(-)